MFGKNIEIEIVYANSEKPELFPYRNLSLKRLGVYYKRLSVLLGKIIIEDERMSREWKSPEGDEYPGLPMFYRCAFFKSAVASFYVKRRDG